jgi:hypothetical protein
MIALSVNDPPEHVLMGSVAPELLSGTPRLRCLDSLHYQCLNFSTALAYT